MLCDRLEKEIPELGPYKHFVGFRYADPLTEETLDVMERFETHFLIKLSKN